MIFDSADLQRLHLILFHDAAKIGPNALLDVRFYPKLPILRAEDDVIVQRRVRVRHDLSRRYATGENVRRFPNRGLKPTATAATSLRDENYRRNVAARRKVPPQRRCPTKTAAVPSLHDENYRRNVATRRKLSSFSPISAYAYVHDRHRIIAENVHHFDRDFPPSRLAALVENALQL
jgi:hypothetical protein